MFNSFYSGKRLFITGHTGFKGAWLSLWLKHLGAQVYGYGLKTPTNPNLHELIAKTTFAAETEGDIRDQRLLIGSLRSAKPDVIFHLAAQPIVRRSYSEPLETLEVNAVGTAKLIDAVRQLEMPCDVIVITTDKCYENREWEYAYREIDPLGGHDVYSASKAAAEIIAQSWNKSFFQPNPKLGKVVTARAGNVIGGGDYAEDRILPDCIRALTANKPIVVRNPKAIRPWQHVLECLSGYMWLASKLAHEKKDSRLATAFNFGPEPSARQSVQALVEQIVRVWPGSWVDGSDPRAVHEAKLLTLSIEKAAALLDWHPCWAFHETVTRSVEWYHRRHTTSTDMLAFTLSQIESYTEAARSKNLSWTK